MALTVVGRGSAERKYRFRGPGETIVCYHFEPAFSPGRQPRVKGVVMA